MTAAVPDPAIEALLHDLWLRVHLRRFDGNDYPDGRPEYVSEQRAVDSFYAGVMKSQHIIEAVAREQGIDRVYDAPSARDAIADLRAVALSIEGVLERSMGCRQGPIQQAREDTPEWAMCMSSAHEHAYYGNYCGFANNLASVALVEIQNARPAARAAAPDALRVRIEAVIADRYAGDFTPILPKLRAMLED